MTGIFASETGFRIQLQVWGYALTGDKSEPIARLCEFREIERILGTGFLVGRSMSTRQGLEADTYGRALQALQSIYKVSKERRNRVWGSAWLRSFLRGLSGWRRV